MSSPTGASLESACEATAPSEGGRPTIADEAANKRAKPIGRPLDELGLTASTRVEVSWEVEMSDGTDEHVWWGAVVALPEGGAAAAGEALLRYDSAHGFAAEERRVVFSSGETVWDAALNEGLSWRVEGAADDEEGEEQDKDAAEPEELPVGSAVKARFQGGDMWHAGTVAAINADGTLDVLYEDRTLEQGIPRDLVRRVALTAAVAAALVEGDEAPPVAESIDDFFQVFVTALTSGATFQRLDAEKQAIASEKVKAMRPAFEAELRALKEERGHGAVVTGEDIRGMLPKIMARQAQAAQ